MRRLLFGLLLLASPALAQEQRTFFHKNDLSATTYTYCVTVEGRGPEGLRITTSGSSTTVTAVSGLPFATLDVGDDLLVNNTGTLTTDRARITAKASGASVTVAAAVNWSNGGNGFPFTFHDLTCGATDTDGWVPTAGMVDKGVMVLIELETGTGGVDFSIECKYSGEADEPSQLLAFNKTGTTSPTFSEVIPIPEQCAAIRVGMKWGTADGAGPDSISAYFLGFKSR
jgi:hypothetical protein